MIKSQTVFTILCDVMMQLAIFFFILANCFQTQALDNQAAADRLPIVELEVVRLDSDLEDSRKTIVNQRNEIEDAEDQAIKAEKELESAKQRNAENSEALVQQEAHIGELTDQLGEASRESGDKSKAISNLNEEVRGLNQRLATVQAGSERKDETIGNLQTEIADVERQLATARKHSEGQFERIAQYAGEVKRLVSERNAYQNDGKAYAQVIEDQRKRIDGSQALVATQQKTIDELRSQNDALASQLKSGDPVTFVVLIDCSASMQQPIASLRNAVATLFEVAPNVSKDFRVGIIAFRWGIVDQFPITRIPPRYEDPEPQKAVLNFLDSLKVEQSAVDHRPVFAEAIAMLNEAHPTPEPNRKERILLLGDIAPSEIDGRRGFSPSENAIKRQIVEDVRRWSKEGDRAIEALYAESDWTRKNDSDPETTKAWFQSLGNVSEQSAFYTDSTSILRAVLHAVLPTE
ncbi:VWA domain-containing protein [Thalassoglobus sp.]|uniref:VWA domain-containing protein n=1 Tax=Thalassoglobus sp. TaxID=2795869 RepID=UPI003AA7D615